MSMYGVGRVGGIQVGLFLPTSIRQFNPSQVSRQSQLLTRSYYLRTSYLCGSSRCARVYPTVVTPQRLCSNMVSYAEEKTKFTPPEGLNTKYVVDEVHRYMVDCMLAVGTPKPQATALADVLVAADTRGHYSHGLNRLEMYVNDVKQKVCDGDALPSITKESVSTALVNGNNGLGPVVGNFCMDLAVQKAKETGIGWVCTRGSNHYGIAGWYAMRATKEGLLGMSFTNTSPLVAPTRAKKIELERRKENPIPEGWALDKDGQPTTNAAEGMEGALMPLGGSELHSGYKGYGLGMLVEIFCGIMSGGQYGPNVRRWMQTDREADLGQCFVAIDPSFFAPGFEDRMSDLMGHCRDMEPSDPSKPVMAAGDPERSHIKKVEQESGITYHINQVTDSIEKKRRTRHPEARENGLLRPGTQIKKA
ncbi:uncharacterized oxidoreductase YjmC-like isoform X2 [Homarus americanus]|uniref:uncharacterized oxidoreductase YjmC-like isoform X2 n=1 Tax=Homarus americanus TaxID=6706 RepID=UPI001C43C343|nr:uncharacterized oxidoreductase YjmC-like isoform X2 [Homarus americanus]